MKVNPLEGKIGTIKGRLANTIRFHFEQPLDCDLHTDNLK